MSGPCLDTDNFEITRVLAINIGEYHYEHTSNLQVTRMKNSQALFFVSALALIGSFYNTTAMAQGQTSDKAIEEVTVLGTRTQGRSALDSAAPVDVISGEDFTNQGSNDMGDILRTLVPSYNVSAQPISDASTFVRPASLRGLAADHTLVLMNGKRRHRSAVINFYTAGDSNGAQGPDISAIPAIAVRQVEVLRDGAAAQYGSDAIAGVINFKLNDSAEGAAFEAKLGSTFEGDGDNLLIAGNIGLPFTSDGFANLSFSYNEADPTDRSIQRNDAAALIAGGNTAVANPAQVWGAPELHDDLKLVANLGLELDSNKSWYAFGNYGNKTAEGGLYYRNPNSRGGVYTSGADALVGDLDGIGQGVACPSFPAGDAAGLALVSDNSTPVGANCFVFNEIFPGGFQPSLEGEVTDLSGVTGVRGDLDSGISYDVSFGAGYNQVAFTVHSINASLGPNTPLTMDAGSFTQLEKNFNVDVTYPVAVEAFASDLNVAAGFEWRNEQFEAKAGNPASYNAGPLLDQGFSSGSQGYVGLSDLASGDWDRSNIALYVDLEAEVTDRLLLGLAARWEDFDDFGTTTNVKVSARWDFTDSFALRTTFSTGFRAPTPGQANIINVSSVFSNGVLVNSGIIPPESLLAQQFGGLPLEPEESENFSVGAVFAIGNLDVTVDYFDIDVDDRITLSSFFSLTPAEAAALEAQGIAGASEFANIRYYTNDFKTNTSGIDLIATYPLDLFGGSTDLTLSANHTETKVESFTPGLLDNVRIRTLEEGLPQDRGSLTLNHQQDSWRFLARANYYGEYYNAHASFFEFDAGSEVTFDMEFAYNFTDNLTAVVGASNIFDEFPDELPPFGAILGSKYPEFSPMGVNGGMYYLRLRYELD